MIKSIVVAVASNHAIGRNNDLLWHLPEDLKRFKSLTTGHHIIMGRKTYDSIGKPLPKRTSVVISANRNLTIEGVAVVHSLQEAFEFCEGEEEVFIIGGGRIYEQALAHADKLYYTQVDVELDGDTYFPEIRLDDWDILKKERVEQSETNAYAFTYYELARKK